MNAHEEMVLEMQTRAEHKFKVSPVLDGAMREAWSYCQDGVDMAKILFRSREIDVSAHIKITTECARLALGVVSHSGHSDVIQEGEAIVGLARLWLVSGKRDKVKYNGKLQRAGESILEKARWSPMGPNLLTDQEINALHAALCAMWAVKYAMSGKSPEGVADVTHWCAMHTQSTDGSLNEKIADIVRAHIPELPELVHERYWFASRREFVTLPAGTM